ncbi:MAG: crossover junction endodeoxyribonuclease RuvC [Chitinophagales bacterium]|nr:crossover junction endodeoxyribonuclease RuvC [Chitinophagales bacterium]
MGFSIIKIDDKRMVLVEMDVIRVNKEKDHYQKLKKIYSGVQQIIHRYRPTDLAIESPFFGKNVQSMLKLGRAQGIAIAVALSEKIEVFEYSPRKIKQSVTGNGNSSKEQVALILSQLLRFDTKHLLPDATDALGVAVCHHFQNKILFSRDSKVSGWKKFIELNPGRIIK